MYLQGEVEEGLKGAEQHLNLFSSEASKTLRAIAQRIYQLARNLRRNKSIPAKIPINLQICYNDLLDLGHEAGKKSSSNLNAAEKEAVTKNLLADLKAVRKKLSLVESLLVQLEKQDQKGDRSPLRV